MAADGFRDCAFATGMALIFPMKAKLCWLAFFICAVVSVSAQD
jgi:hypothetical protein